MWVSVFGKLKVKTGLRTVCKCASRRTPYLADICSKSKKRNTRAIGEICSKLSINTSDLCQWCCSGVFIVSFEEFSHIVLVLPLFTLNKWISGGHWLHTTVQGLKLNSISDIFLGLLQDFWKKNFHSSHPGKRYQKER